MPYVNSSAISFISHDPSTLTLTIVFKESGSYEFFQVPTEIYEAFLTANSIGKFYNMHIKDKY